MPGQWQGSHRRAELPPGWDALRLDVLRDAQWRCVELLEDGSRCRKRASDVDHRVPGNDHGRGNLQALCRQHHKAKTAKEAAEARRAKYNRKRARSAHPGLIVP